MAFDAFEGRMAFLKLLRRLTGTQASASKASQFAIKNRHLDEDLFSCILEEINTTTLNARVNMLYFLETLCRESAKLGLDSYLDMVKQAFLEIIEAVVPQGRDGAANAETTQRVLEHFRQGKLLDEDMIANAEHILTTRRPEQTDGPNEDSVFSKDDIFKRMEQDRERHKRLREKIWEVPEGPSGDIVEFNQMWDTCSSLCDDDLAAMQEELGKLPR